MSHLIGLSQVQDEFKTAGPGDDIKNPVYVLVSPPRIISQPAPVFIVAILYTSAVGCAKHTSNDVAIRETAGESAQLEPTFAQA